MHYAKYPTEKPAGYFVQIADLQSFTFHAILFADWADFVAIVARCSTAQRVFATAYSDILGPDDCAGVDAG